MQGSKIRKKSGLSGREVYLNIKLKRTFFLLAMSLTCLAGSAQIVINEFSAANATILADPDYNEYADWVELYNHGTADQNLRDFYLSDDLSTPDKWKIEHDTLIPAGGHLLIWCDDQNTGLHTSFKLSAEGEEIGLFSPTLVLLDSLTFSHQRTNISLGRVSDGSDQWAYFPLATPGTENAGRSYPGFTSLVPEFSMRGGFYSSPFSVELSSPQGGVIRYTLDGSDPDENSEIYGRCSICGRYHRSKGPDF